MIRVVCDQCDKLLLSTTPHVQVTERPEVGFGPDDLHLCGAACLLTYARERFAAESGVTA